VHTALGSSSHHAYAGKLQRLARSSVKASLVRVREVVPHSIDRLQLRKPGPRRPRKPRARRFDAEELRKLWCDPQRLKQVLGESDPE
jgi:hypothetical protein